MPIWIFLLGLIFSFGSSTAQTYKYVNRDGAICFTDTPTSSLSREKTPAQNKPHEGVKHAKGRAEVKDILQLAQEMLDEELAKPPKKQNQKLILELNEILYGDVSGKSKSK